MFRERPFNLKGGGGYGFFLKNILIPNVAETNILILVEEKKKKFDSEFFSFNLMLYSGKKFALCVTKNINIRTLVLSEKTNSEQSKKP